MTRTDREQQSEQSKFTIKEVRNNLHRPEGIISDEHWAAGSAVYDIIEEMHGKPVNRINDPQYGANIATRFEISPFNENEGPVPRLLGPVIVTFYPTRHAVMVTTKISERKRIVDRTQPLLIDGLIRAESRGVLTAKKDELKGAIRQVALASQIK